MELIGKLVGGWVTASGLSTAAVARRAGVSRSTLHRVLNSQVDASIGTVEEIAIACGVSLELTARPLSDRFAAAAARVLLEGQYQPPDDPGVAEWEKRLERIDTGDDPIDIVQAAAEASNPLGRTDGVFFTGEVTVLRLASAGEAAKGRWALSGAAGIELKSRMAPRVTIMWCDDPTRVAQMLTKSRLRETRDPSRASIAVLTAEPELFADTFEVRKVRYAAPIQILIDCVAFGGAVAAAAIQEARTW